MEKIMNNKFVKYDIQKIKQDVKIKDMLQTYINNLENIKVNKGQLYKDCPFCLHHWHFYISKNNTYGSFSKCCESGTVIDFISNLENISFSEAISKLGSEHIVKGNCDWEPNAKRIFDICKLLESYRVREMKLLVDEYFDWIKFIGDREMLEEMLPLNDIEQYQKAWNWRNER
jgi:hypothetical protein